MRKKLASFQPDLPPLSEVIAQHGLSARRRLGQHFLLDLNITDRMVRTAGDLAQKNVIEVGPGPGGLTRSLLKSNAHKITVIEQDARCLPILEDLQNAYPRKLSIHVGDALKLDLTTLTPEPRCLIANLPYNISTPLLIGWLKQISSWERITIMLQKEVADRLTASPGNKVYGRLSVMSQWLCRIKHEFDVNKRSFVPPPKVTSSVVTLEPYTEPIAPVSWKAMEQVTQMAFGQRRKMIRASLKRLDLDLDELEIDPSVRAENLDISDYCRLAQSLERKQETKTS